MIVFKKQSGFTLIEIAIVLVIVSILLGYTVAMFPIQQELKQYRKVDSEMNDIIAQLVAFAQVNGRLPCPDSDGDGLEDYVAVTGESNCNVWFGNIPAKTMAVEGDYDANGLLLDPWGSAYLYQVSALDVDANDSDDFTTANEMRAVGIAALAATPTLPDINICNVEPAGNPAQDDVGCDPNTDVINNVVAVVLSQGKDKGSIASDIQSENTDNSVTDTVFVSTTRNDSAGSEFDDVVKWVSPNVLYSKMIDAGQLP